MDKILIKRGMKEKLEKSPPLSQGELFLAKDEERLYVGGPKGNIPIATQQEVDEKYQEVATRLAQTEEYIEINKLSGLSIEAFPRIIPENNDNGRFSRLIENGITNVLLLPKGEFTVSDSVSLPSNVKVIGQGDDTKIRITQTGKPVFSGIGVSNVGIYNLYIEGVSVSGKEETSAGVGVSFIDSYNIEVSGVNANKLNVGFYIRFCDRVRLLNNVANDMVITSEGTTGYGFNTDGTTNLFATGNKAYNCERHGFYIGNSSKTPKNQLFYRNEVIWDKTEDSPASFQAGFKTFNSEGIDFIENIIEGTKQAFWFPCGVNRIKVLNNKVKNIRQHAILIHGPGTTEPQNLITINGNEIINDVKATNYNAIFIVNEPKMRYLFAKDNYIKGFSAGFVLPSSMDGYEIGVNTFEDCDKGYFFTPGGREGVFGKIENPILINTPMAHQHYTTNIFADGDTTPSVKNSNLWEVINTQPTTITNFDDGMPGQEITVVFLLNDNTTLKHSTSLRLQGGLDFKVPANTVMKFVYVRDGWRELSRVTSS